MPRPTAIRLLVAGYALITLVGAALLSLPVSTTSGSGQGFLDALFLASSGISTSGLTTVDVGSFYSLFGQITLATIFQVGGLGYMAFFMLAVTVLGRRLSFRKLTVAAESVSGSDRVDLRRFFAAVVLYTLAFEGAGAAILFLRWVASYPVPRAAYLGVFHSVSAFCTAGFSVFPDSLMAYRSDLTTNITISLLSLFGGVGFLVLYDTHRLILRVSKNKYPRRLAAHTKLVLVFTAFVVAGASVAIFVVDPTCGATVRDRMMSSVFQAVSASTTDGFNTMDIGGMAPTSLLVLIVLMFIGASPGSTGGGIKMTTFGVLALSVWSYLRGRTETDFFRRRIPPETTQKASAVFLLCLTVVAADMLVMSATEKASFLRLLFEVVSAMGNTGLSTGITSSLTATGKVLLIATMFLGRVGPLAVGLSLLARSERTLFKNAAEDVYVG
ncbi:MAG: Trk family potassium uptake protein [Candidatus Eisenbacteria bacterium]|nr:Trk family potassium uptake protein [Candidatus Eisenbacteria bacterium]